MDTSEKPVPMTEPITNGTSEPEKVEEIKHEEKEEKEDLTEEQKAAEKAKPISSTPVPGTPWYIVKRSSSCFNTNSEHFLL